MFRSLLVANRGEIACRIFRTARAMGLRALAVHSQADAKAKHVREADASFLLGPAPAAQSYLRFDRVLEAARALGADAIHPGYGFLSENPDFAEAVVAAGLVWVGPTPAAIRAMGLKDEAKRIAAQAGVPVLEGYAGEDQSEKRLLKAAKEIGWPVLVKAVAGGGGRGIREAGCAEELRQALASAKREAKAAFGDDRVLIEKLVERPRHIEVQVFGDAYGNVVHLFERDCSLQRRRQKVIEEAPAPGMTAPVRAAMTQAALTLARAVEYRNAGTVEFIVDGTGPLRPDGFWFLEMNTRLQVEHPVTEAITGLDLVEWQLRVAAGERLPLTQDEITMTGHAIEARICAEDPAEGFRPSVGQLRRRVLGHTVCAPRIDAGYDDGDTVPAAYDNLVEKVVVRGEDRTQAIEDTLTVLDNRAIYPLKTNQGFLYRCLQLDAFRSGDVHTGFIDANLEALLDRGAARAQAIARLAPQGAAPAGDPWSCGDGFRLNGPARRVIPFELDGALINVDASVANAALGPSVTAADGLATIVAAQGETFAFYPPGARADLAGADAGDEVKAPLPGRIVAVAARQGASVKKGEALVTLEAMKMEHTLKAPRDGIIVAIAATAGAQVKEGAVLVRLEAS